MTVSQLPNGRQQFSNVSGLLVGGLVYTYVPGTTTFATTYQDSAGTVANTNPIVLDALGSAAIWGSGPYRQVVFDYLGNEIWDTVTSAMVGSSVPSAIVTLTGSGTFTVPANISRIEVERWGGGGGGGGGSSANGGSGGGGGAYGRDVLTVSSGQVISYSCGSGGTAGTTSAAGGAGGSTTFGTLTSVSGGSGGIANGSASASGGSAPTGSAVAFAGGAGSGYITISTLYVGGQGGTSPFGGIGGPQATAAGISGVGPGAGGGGGANANVGSAGQAGQIVVSY